MSGTAEALSSASGTPLQTVYSPQWCVGGMASATCKTRPAPAAASCTQSKRQPSTAAEGLGAKAAASTPTGSAGTRPKFCTAPTRPRTSHCKPIKYQFIGSYERFLIMIQLTEYVNKKRFSIEKLDSTKRSL